MYKSSAIKVSNAQIQLQQATPTPSDRDIAELEHQLFAPIAPVATGTSLLQSRTTTRIVKSKGRKIAITKLPGRTPSTPKKQRKRTNKPAARKRINRN